MNSKIIVLFFALVLIAQAAFAATLMTSEQLSELNKVEGKAEVERSVACGRQCLSNKGIDPDGGFIPINTSVYCNIVCSSNPCTVSCFEECDSASNQCYDKCSWNCNRPKIEACEAACEAYENAGDNWYMERCTCVCKRRYVLGAGDCVLDDGSGGNGDKPDDPCTGPDCDPVKEDECSSTKKCPGNQFCKNGECVAKGSLSISVDKKELYHGKTQKVTITAKLTGEKEATIVFDILDEENVLTQVGEIITAIEETSNGQATVTLTIPKMGTHNFVNNKPDAYPYTAPIEVIAFISSESDKYNLVAYDSITLLSPLPDVESISVNPPIALAFGTPVSIVVSIKDPDGESGDEYRYLYDTYSGGSFQKSSEQAKVDRYLDKVKRKQSSVLYYAPEIGLQAGEAVFAREMMKHYESLGISCSIKGGELILKQGLKIATKGSGRFVPVISTILQAKEVSDSLGRGIDKVKSLSDSSNAKEVMWKSVDIGLEGVRGCVGTVCYFSSVIPGVGQLGEVAQTGIDTALAAGQAGMQVLIAKEKEKNSTVRTKRTYVYLKIKDPNGYTAKYLDVVEVPVSYIWTKGAEEE